VDVHEYAREKHPTHSREETTLSELRGWFGPVQCDLPDATKAVLLSGWFAGMHSGVRSYPDETDPQKVADYYVTMDQSWRGNDMCTVYVPVTVWRVAIATDRSGNPCEVKIDEHYRLGRKHPWQEPPCCPPQHRWERTAEPRVGRQGGIRTDEICSHCGWHRYVTTWEDGHAEVEYERRYSF
jgi:hypothetical protein